MWCLVCWKSTWSWEFILIDLKVAILEGYYGRVVGCSGISKKYGIMLYNGTIDSDYRGVVGVILFNFSNEEYIIERGDRIAQVIFERYYTLKLREVSDFSNEKTEGGERGFGSTGVWFFLAYWKNLVAKMEAKYPKLRLFEKVLYHYETIENFHYKLLNIMLPITHNSWFYCFCNKYKGCKLD